MPLRTDERSGRSDALHGRSTGSRRALGAVPGLILLVAFGVLAVTKPDAVRSAFDSGRALLLIGAFVLVWLALSRFVLPRLVRSVALRSALLSALALTVVALVVLPYFRDKEVNERFPTVEAARATGATREPATPAAPAPRTEPVLVSSGELEGIDHSAEGGASVYAQPDGSFVVELKDIDIQSGPDYFVHLVPGTDREDPDGGTNLGELKGNQGTQYYEVPDGTRIDGDWTVLIWCRAFSVPIANASQTAA